MATPQQVEQWLRANPKRDGGSWDQWCGSLCFRLCDAFGSAPNPTPPSAISAWHSCRTDGTDPSAAPPGAAHYWDIGADGHVGIDMDGGGTRVAMASRRVDVSVGDAIGWASVRAYSSRTGARYLGWSRTYGSNGTVNIAVTSAAGSNITALIDYGNAAGKDNLIGLQEWLARDWGYTGYIDGVMGDLSWSALQRFFVANYGYTGDLDGAPGSKSWWCAQEWLRDHWGYTGDIDGKPGELTYAALARAGRGLSNAATKPADSGTTPLPPVVTPPVVVVPEPVIPTLAGRMFGIDIGTTQAGIDLATFKSKGGAFVGIKMGGGNAPGSPYTAPKYLEQLYAARDTGMPIIHYWFNGQKVPVAKQAEYFADNARFAPGDILAIDVEGETDTGTRAFTPAEVLEFIGVLDRHFPGIKVLIYMSASVTRQPGWDAVAALGHGLWVASYGSNNGLPNGAPEIGGWTEWVIWQYSSVNPDPKVPGWTGAGLDRNFASLDLFAKYGYRPPTTEPPTGDRMTELLAELGRLITKYAD